VSSVITIAMPVKNRLFCIDVVLQAVYSQTYPKNKIKVLFLDDENTDGTLEKLVQWKSMHETEYLSVQILPTKSGGYISKLRNICVANMEGDVIVFWDSDTLTTSVDDLSRMLKLLDDDSVYVSGFPCYREHPDISERIYQAGNELGGMGFAALKKTVFEKVGFFNEQFKVNEDTDIYSRVKAKGMRIVFDGSTPCVHLKEAHTRKSGLKASFSSYKWRIRRGFYHDSLLYAEMIKAGSRSHFFKTIYYLLLPVITIFCILNLVFPVFSPFWVTILWLAYVAINLLYHILKAKVNRLFGVISFLYQTPCGIAVSYGYLYNMLKRKTP
jgi:glycosyltransferase involved in cell wall biosynthesis